MNKKGFALAETIIVSAVVLTTLILIYSQFSKVNRNYSESYDFNSINGIYSLKKVSTYLEEQNISSLYDNLTTYLSIRDCDLDYYTDKDYCNMIMDKANIKYIFFTYNNRSAIYSELSKSNEYDKKLLDYIQTIDDSRTDYTYRIIAEFNDGTYASVPFGYGSYYKDPVLKGSDPVLTDGLIPVTYDDASASWVVADKNSVWYSYQDKKWANAILLEQSLNNDQKAVASSIGHQLTADEVGAHFVWIPRYQYSIPASNIGKTNSDILPIDIDFIPSDKIVADAGYNLHPGFTFGGEVGGFWFGKFETTGDSVDTQKEYTCVNENCAEKVTIKPNQKGSYGKVANQFYAARSVANQYNLNIDSHMSKYTEWTAVSYLTNSIYGRCTTSKCTEVSINNSSGYYTGRSAGIPGTSSIVKNEQGTYTYEKSEGQLSSTTGNIYGVYDVSGGLYEYVMGVLLDSNGNPRSGRNETANSGFMGILSSGTNNSTLPFPENKKYYDTFTSSDSNIDNYSVLTHVNGVEGDFRGVSIEFLTSPYSASTTVYGDLSKFITADNPWLHLGGGFYSNTDSGIFNLNNDRGSAFDYIGFRVVLTP